MDRVLFMNQNHKRLLVFTTYTTYSLKNNSKHRINRISHSKIQDISNELDVRCPSEIGSCILLNQSMQLVVNIFSSFFQICRFFKSFGCSFVYCFRLLDSLFGECKNFHNRILCISILFLCWLFKCSLFWYLGHKCSRQRYLDVVFQ